MVFRIQSEDGLLRSSGWALSPRIVATAAHNWPTIGPTNVKVVGPGGQEFSGELKRHPLFQDPPLFGLLDGHDVARIELDGDVPTGQLSTTKTVASTTLDGALCAYAGFPAPGLTQISAGSKIVANSRRFGLIEQGNPEIKEGMSGGPITHNGNVVALILSTAVLGTVLIDDGRPSIPDFIGHPAGALMLSDSLVGFLREGV